VSAIVPLTIEGLVSVLLLLTILYCVRLNSQLKRLKADETAMKTTIAELLTATGNAERAIAGLKTTVHEADQNLSESLRAAERFSGDIKLQIEAGSELLDRLTQIAGVRAAGSATPQPAKPATPDPKAIVAAAQAFAERARSRVKGLAA
jgi:hypothetical protein